MKFKHLFLGFWAVCAFASCSDGENGGVEIPNEKMIETSLSISATSPQGTATKTVKGEGTDKGVKGEQFIHTLTALIFDENGALAAMETATSTPTTGESLTTIENIIIKVKAEEAGEVSNSTFKVILVANIIPEKPADLTGFKAAHFTGISNYTYAGVNGDTQSQYLPMSSEEVTVTSLVAGMDYNNWIKATEKKIAYVKKETNQIVSIENGKVGEPTGGVYTPTENDQIELTRYVARIQLESLATDFSENLSGASFELTKVSLANASNASLYGGDKLTYVIGSNADGAYAGNAFFRGYPKTITRADYYLANGSYDNTKFLKSYDNVTLKNKGSISFSAGEMAQFYAFEFDGYDIKDKDGAGTVYTTLIITGKITGVSGIDPNEERSFRIPIKHTTGSSPDAGVSKVVRNYIYKVNATLTGTGSPNPDETLLNACVSFSVKVEPWNVIKQVEDDVN